MVIEHGQTAHIPYKITIDSWACPEKNIKKKLRFTTKHFFDTEILQKCSKCRGNFHFREPGWGKNYRPVRHSRMIRPSFSYPLNSLYLISQRFNHSWYRNFVLYQNVQKYVLIKTKILWFMIGVTFSWYHSKKAKICTFRKSMRLTKVGFPHKL